MVTIVWILWGAVTVGLLLASGMQPRRSDMSQFELDRRAKGGESGADLELRRTSLYGDVLSLQRVVIALLLVLSVLLSVSLFGWMVGIVVALVTALEYGAVSRIKVVQDLADSIYLRFELSVLSFVERSSRILRFVRTAVPEGGAVKVHSREELKYVVSYSTNSVLSSDERKLILNSLDFNTRLVGEIMTPRSVIESIDKKEHLGPLVLNNLHETGYSRFPVIDGDIDHVIGILHVRDLLTIDAKRKSTSVEKAMDQRVFYIKEDQTLGHALSAFLKTRYHMFVVVNTYRETVGVLSLEDVIEALLGRKIVDEFDAHDNLRAVAERNPRGNNTPASRTDV